MTEQRRARQTVLLLSTAGAPLQLNVEETPAQIASTPCDGKFLPLHQPLGSGADVFVDSNAIVAMWEQEVVLETDPRQFGMQRTPSGIHLPDLPKVN